MNANATFTRQRIEEPGRFAIAIECADDLTNDEIIRMEAVIEAQVCLLQRQKRGYRPEHVAPWKAAA